MIIKSPTYHPYYCAESNFFSNDPRQEYDSVTEFLDAFDDADIDYNLVFRFDVKEDEDTHNLSLFIAMMLQRKGIYKPILCLNYNPETEGERLMNYLQRHFQRNLDNWQPLRPNTTFQPQDATKQEGGA